MLNCMHCTCAPEFACRRSVVLAELRRYHQLRRQSHHWSVRVLSSTLHDPRHRQRPTEAMPIEQHRCRRLSPGFPIGAKTSSNTPTIVQCITVGSACPAGFTLPLYNGAARVECRPNIGCVYTNYGTKITNGTSDDPIGCLIDGATECPFVAFRSASNNFKIDFCRDVASCPTTTSHTVPAQSSTAVVPRACLTLGSPTQACPDIPGLSFPLEVVDAKPNQPCGSATLLCTDTRVVRCLPAASTCPLGFGLQLFKNPNGPASTPELVECRCADYQLS